ncbi:haloacid dehalogenase superfamily protein [Lachancea thermotolerans CBS 6340]|uniref:KLTH0D07194p n=1 Tax=Lachancea thermotolerans (strain ATCC 56472 / CBS 6340 / NRRL Y-8284) TaxID=559295 RepID=C5DGQ4_LACTC|nr:KLTH0D07194p [Lachancea thermotolerans CBS 6340]CAR22596.1 KLTH0D07194p [Lachancea thermotolerans CBS 6340]
MDGLLINTEDIYTLVTNEILTEYGKGPLTWDLKVQLQGLPGPEACRKVLDHFQLPVTPQEFDRKNIELQCKMWPKCSFLPGALDLIRYLHSKNIPIALCTSSAKHKFEGKTSHLKHGFELFDAIVTGDDPRIPPGRGKPFPDIWLVGLKELNNKFKANIQPEECLIFEDGVPGVTAAKAAGGYVVWIPHPDAYDVLGDTDAILDGKGELISSLVHLDKAKFGL